MSVKGQTNGSLLGGGGWRSGGESSLFVARHRPEKKGMGDGAKLLSEAAASFEPHQGTFNPS